MALERIEKYLKNQMDPADRQTFEQELERDESLVQEVAAFKDVQQIVEVAGDEAFLANLRSIEKELAEPEKVMRPLWGRRVVLGIAAAVIILLAGIWVFQPKTLDSADMFAENFQAYPPPARLRGESKQDQTWDAARTAYIQEN
jgi:anti-sigma factor RsiW